MTYVYMYICIRAMYSNRALTLSLYIYSMPRAFVFHRAQSLTKFYDGHNMTVGGAVASATKEIDSKIRFYSNIHGNILR